MCEQPEYFSLIDYVKSIKIDESLIEHLEITNIQFFTYLKKLASYDSYSVIYFWIDSLFEELRYSSLAEGVCPPEVVLKNNLFFDNLRISNNRIHKLHSFVINGGVEHSNYRNNDVKVSGVSNGKERIDFLPPSYKDVLKFMNDFIKLYKNDNFSMFNNNPFLEASLLQLLLIRIQPYCDGNKRTARMVSNMKFTDRINEIYGTKLKVCPLNISHNIYTNQITYFEMIKAVPFNLEDDPSIYINKFLNFMLYMYDEQLYYLLNRIDNYHLLLQKISNETEIENKIFLEMKKMKLQKIRNLV